MVALCQSSMSSGSDQPYSRCHLVCFNKHTEAQCFLVYFPFHEPAQGAIAYPRYLVTWLKFLSLSCHKASASACLVSLEGSVPIACPDLSGYGRNHGTSNVAGEGLDKPLCRLSGCEVRGEGHTCHAHTAWLSHNKDISPDLR